MTTYIKIDVSVHTWVSREGDPDDRWDRDSTDGTVSVVGASIVPEDGYNVLEFDGDIKDGQLVYVVWGQYSTGDTFGSDGGQYELLEVHTDPVVAEQRAKHISEIKDYSVPWNGYFERLDFVTVTPLTVAKQFMKYRGN